MSPPPTLGWSHTPRPTFTFCPKPTSKGASRKRAEEQKREGGNRLQIRHRAILCPHGLFFNRAARFSWPTTSVALDCKCELQSLRVSEQKWNGYPRIFYLYWSQLPAVSYAGYSHTAHQGSWHVSWLASPCGSLFLRVCLLYKGAQHSWPLRRMF